MRSFSKFLLCFSLAACTTHAKNEKTYVSIDLPVENFEKIKTDLEKSQNVALKSRGEAHITLITPPEYKTLRKTLSREDIQNLLEETGVLKAPYKLLCVGKGVVKEKATYYVVVESPAYFQFRSLLAEKFLQRGGAKDRFKPLEFYPHVTVGFTERDLHLEEGVIKDTKSCLYDLKINSP